MFRLQLFVCAINAYTAVSKHALGSTPYIICQIAAAQSEMQEHDSAINSFQMVRRMDPYRIDQMHLFSNSLYIQVSNRKFDTIRKSSKFIILWNFLVDLFVKYAFVYINKKLFMTRDYLD